MVAKCDEMELGTNRSRKREFFDAKPPLNLKTEIKPMNFYHQGYNDNLNFNLPSSTKNNNFNFKQSFYSMNPRKQKSLLRAFEDLIQDQQIVEEKKIDLALRSDFCLSEIFELIHGYQSPGSSVKVLIQDVFKLCNLKQVTRQDVITMMRKYDQD